jgi:hypothetical protein
MDGVGPPAPKKDERSGMDELAARAALVSAPDLQGGVTTSVRRSEIEEALAQNELPIELMLDVTRYAEGKPTDTGSIAVSWEREDLERLLQEAEGDEVALTFDREALRQALESDVEAHGIREKILVLAVAATAATGGAAAASAEPGAYLGSGAPITQEAGPEIPYLSHGQGVTAADLGIPTGTSPDDRAVPRATPVEAPSVSPDDRAFPRSPVEAPSTGTASDPGITWAPSPAETAAIAGAIALMITGAFFVVGGRRRARPGPA